MPSETEFVDYITDRDRIRVKFTLERGVPERIVVELECEVDGRWMPARRYDNRHGHMHVHVRPWDDSTDRTQEVAVPGLRQALSILIGELQVNWQAIRSRLVADVGPVQNDA